MRLLVAWLVLGCLLVVSAARAAAGDAPPAAVPDPRAKAAVAALDEALRTGTGSDRAAAVRTCGATDHRLVADRLVALALDDDVPQEVRAAAFESLSLQKAARTSVRTRVARWVAKQAEADADARKRGDLSVPVDRKTGDAISKGPAYEAAVKAGAARAAWIASAVRCLGGLGASEDAVGSLRAFVQSAHDDLAVAAVDVLGAWKSKDALPDLLFLFRMYPRENRWETSAVAHIGGTNASAKAEWMRYFGHPLKQRARPEVHRAIRAAVESITGRKVASPEELDGMLAGGEAERGKR